MASIEEKELEDFLMEDPANLERIGIQLGNFVSIHRQLWLGSYGKADIVCIDPTVGPEGSYWFEVSIIELKKGQLDVNALTQAARYLVGLKHHLEGSRAQKEGVRHNFSYRITLVGGEINPSDWVYLSQFTPFEAYTYSLDLASGISFEQASLHHYRVMKPEFSKDFESLLSASRANYAEAVEENKFIRDARTKALPAPEALPADAHDEAKPNG